MESVIYALVDPRDKSVRYVGHTSALRGRLAVHRYQARKGYRDHRARWIRGLLLAGLEPECRVLSECGVSLAPHLECYWIATLRNQGCSLTNHTDGGEGMVGMRHTDESKARIGSYWKGKKRGPHSPLHTQRLSEACKARGGPSPEVRRKANEARRGGTGSPLQRSRVSEAMQRCWSDPEWRAEWYRRRWQSKHKESTP